ALPLVAAIYVAGRSHHLKIGREVSPSSLIVGDSATVQVQIDNAGPSTGVLLLEERLPYALGGRPRFVVQPMHRSAHELLEYSVRPEIRGRHRLGPMQVRLREPFGMVEMRQEVSGEAELLVTPRVTPLHEIRLGGGWFASGEDHPRSFTVGHVADVVVREYRRGDDLRRVHWRSTARMGELMVRNEEQLWQARATVVLDNRAVAHRGTGSGSSLESAVGAAASVAVHLSGLGYQVRLVTGSGITEAWHERGRPLDPFPLLEELATVEAIGETTLPDLAWGEDTTGGIIVGILGASQVEDRRWWARFPRHSAQSLALVLDVDDWGQPFDELRSVRGTEPEPSSPPGWLTSQGWRAATLSQGGELAPTWRELDR
ncbi:MAG: DUF58 domain-containing protein, partial [Actinomycetota bacterium]|nr:DUF58 domain-containing protein [Actinomycetota bacterium]